MDFQVKIGDMKIIEGLTRGPVLIKELSGTDYLHDGITEGTYFAPISAGSGGSVVDICIGERMSSDRRWRSIGGK
jgi:hypothetical protein